jgi:hypothetical protein
MIKLKKGESMKKFVFSSALICAALLTGCSSKKPLPGIPQTAQCVINSQKAPVWICTGGNVKGYYTAVGSAPKTPLGFSFQKTEAVSAARDALAREISIRVKNMFKRFESNTGVKNNLVSEKVVQNVSKQISDVTMRNSKILTTWQAKDGTLFVLVGVPKNDVKSAVKTAVYSQQKKDAKTNWKELDKAINQTF